MVNMKVNKRMRVTKQRRTRIPCQFGWTAETPWVAEMVSDVKLSNTTLFSLNEYIKKKDNISKIKTSLKSKATLTKVPTLTLRREPFHLGIVENFLTNKENISFLYQDMQSLDWNTKKMDLYEFYQSQDLSCTTSKYLKQFYNFLQTDVMQWMSEITGLEFTKVSATCSMYNATNYLLPHDDMLEDRLVAYIFYICPWRLSNEYSKELSEAGWSCKMGGSLKLFTVNKYNEPVYPHVDTIAPRNNMFLFFKVNQISYHEVGEVLTSDYSRLSINGWFHGPKKTIEPQAINNPTVSAIFYNPKESANTLEEYIESNYLTSKIKKDINIQIEENSEISLAKFFKQIMYDKMQESLKSCVQWKRMGPVNKCNYEIAVIENIYDFLYSDSFISLLKSYTDLNLPLGDLKLKKSLIDVQIQRWTSGCYTVIHDKSEYDCDELDIIFYFNCDENSMAGAITYLDPEDAEENVLLTIYPKNNNLNIVFRTSGTTRFTKYVNQKMIDSSKYFYIISCKYKEIIDV